MIKKNKKKIKLPKDSSLPDELFTNPDEVFATLLDDIKDSIDPTGSLKKISKLDQNQNNNKTSDQDNSSEIHISGRIDNFLFGKIKDPYFEELEKSGDVFRDNQKNNQLFLEKFFSLFLEKDPFSEKTNLQLFEEIIDTKKFLQHCPNFYKIYLTVLPEAYENKEIVSKDGEPYLKTKHVRSTAYDHYSFLEEILDSPSHLSQNTNPETDNQFRVFSDDLFIEIFNDGKKIEEGQLGKFLDLKEAELDDDFNFKYSDKQKEAFDNLTKNKLSYWGIRPAAATKQNSIRHDGFWPIGFFKFVFGNSPELFKEGINLYGIYENFLKYKSEKEVKICFSNVSKCIFKFPEKIDFEKLIFLRCGLDEVCRSAAINYDDNTNLFNYIAYNGELIKPEETIFGDKGIDLQFCLEPNRQPDFYDLFIN